MALLILFLSFFSALYGAWVFFTGYFGAENATQQIAAALSGMGFAVIPYILGKALADMVAIRQRHVQSEQSAFFSNALLDVLSPKKEATPEETAKKAENDPKKPEAKKK